MKKHIALIGFMATGKTTVGQALAKELGLAFSDSDQEIEKKHRQTVADIFATQGEGFFRQAESLVLQELCQTEAKVIATGGGAVTQEENLRTLLRHAHVVCLQASPEVIIERTAGDKTRPLLKAPDKLSRISDLLAQRRPYYEQAELVIDTDCWQLEEIIRQIKNYLAERGWELTDSRKAWQ